MTGNLAIYFMFQNKPKWIKCSIRLYPRSVWKCPSASWCCATKAQLTVKTIICPAENNYIILKNWHSVSWLQIYGRSKICCVNKSKWHVPCRKWKKIVFLFPNNHRLLCCDLETCCIWGKNTSWVDSKTCFSSIYLDMLAIKYISKCNCFTDMRNIYLCIWIFSAIDPGNRVFFFWIFNNTVLVPHDLLLEIVKTHTVVYFYLFNCCSLL